MSITEFLNYLHEGREIECHFAEKMYFIQPCYDKSAQKESIFNICLYYCPTHEETIELFCGTPEELLNFRFDDKYALEENWSLFNVDYIL